MQIGYLVNFQWYPPKSGGAVHAYQVATQLMRRGHAINSIYYDAPAPGLNIFRRRHLMRFIKTVDILYIRTHGAYGFEKFTILKFLKPFSLPVVWEVNAPMEELLTNGKSKREVEYYKRKRRFQAKFVNAAICISKEMKDYACNELEIRNAEVVPNGSDKDLFSPLKKDAGIYSDYGDCFKLIWTGSAQYSWQGIELILEVARRIAEIDRKVIILLITKRRYLERRISPTENIIVLDEKDYFEVPTYIASADVGFCLYDNYSWFGKFYGSSLKLFDYMACGLPVIASGLGQIREVIRHGKNGILVDNSVDEIIKQIFFLKNNPEIARRIGQEARQDVERYYNWERVGEETEKVLKSVLYG